MHIRAALRVMAAVLLPRRIFPKQRFIPMIDRDEILRAHWRARFMRPDAARFMRPDAARFLIPGTDPATIYPALALKYSPNQRRIPAGRTGGGRWTDEEEGGGGRGPMPSEDGAAAEGGDEGFDGAEFDEFGNFTNSESYNVSDVSDNSGNLGGLDVTPESQLAKKPVINDPRVISDVEPEPVFAGEQYAQNRTRGGGTVLINGQQFELTPSQAANLAVVQARATDSIARVQEVEPNWRPPPSLYRTPDGLIRSYEADAAAAQARAYELAAARALPGPFAGESIPARGPERNFTQAERQEINRIGSETGCHSCGTREPGTPSENFVPDHQPPNFLNPTGRSQRLFPHCLTCSLKQGPSVRRLR